MALGTRVSLAIILGAVIVSSVNSSKDSSQRDSQDVAAQGDLRTGMSAEQHYFAEHGKYSRSVDDLRVVDPEVPGLMTIDVEDDVAGKRDDVVCLEERPASGSTFAIASVAEGVNMGTYHGQVCPSPLTSYTAVDVGTEWG